LEITDKNLLLLHFIHLTELPKFILLKYTESSHVRRPLLSQIIHLLVKLCLSCKFTFNLAKSLILSLNSLSYTHKSAHSNSCSSAAAYSNLIFISDSWIYSAHSISSSCPSIYTWSPKLPIPKSLLCELYLNRFFLIFKFVLLNVHKFIFLSFL
jgi:hypothetical protein